MWRWQERWVSGVSLERALKMQFRNAYFRSLVHCSKKLWPKANSGNSVPFILPCKIGGSWNLMRERYLSKTTSLISADKYMRLRSMFPAPALPLLRPADLDPIPAPPCNLRPFPALPAPWKKLPRPSLIRTHDLQARLVTYHPWCNSLGSSGNLRSIRS